MRLLIATTASSITMALLTIGSATAQTPDNQTPAQEGVCDVLKADGITKGLYGLCVAFCEAQDLADENIPIDPVALADEAPSGRILANYNKKKQAGDPDMPCIKISEPCPCWSAEELASIDGRATNGNWIGLQCESAGPGASRIREGDPSEHVAVATSLENFAGCVYMRDQMPAPFFLRILNTTEGTLTLQQGQACVTEINDACESIGQPLP